MPAYNVLVRDVSYRCYPVIAESEDDAIDKLLEGDLSVYFTVGGGEGEIVSEVVSVARCQD